MILSGSAWPERDSAGAVTRGGRHRQAKRGRAGLAQACIRAVLQAIFLVIFFLIGAGRALAYQASMRFDYEVTTSKTTDLATGSVSESRLASFDQLYTFDISRAIYPHLMFDGGATFIRNMDKNEPGGGPSATSTSDSIRPYAQLSLDARPFVASLQFTENRTKTGYSGSPSSTIVQDSYLANFQWTPYGLPPLQLSYEKYHTYDPAHVQTDIVNDTLSFSTFYNLLPNLHLGYQGSYGIFTNNLSQVTNKDLSNAVQASFSTHGSRSHLNVAFGASTDRLTTETTVQSSGLVYFRVIPLDAYSLGPDTVPATATIFQQSAYDTQNENQGLIDGNTSAAAVSKNGGTINIGTGGNPSPNGSLVYSYHMGIEFQNNPAANSFFVYVNDPNSQNLGDIQNFFPDTAFSWAVYTSSDGRTWVPVTLAAQVSYQTIDPFGHPASGFEIDLPAGISAGWVQIVVSPLSNQAIIGVPQQLKTDLATISVTEVSVFDRRPAQQVQSVTQNSSAQFVSIGYSRIILQNPDLAFSMYYTANSGGTSRFMAGYLASVGLNLQQTFKLSKTLTGTASFYTEEGRNEKSGATGMSLVYNTGLTWVPLPTLRSSVVYTGTSTFGKGPFSQLNSVFLDNTAQLYQGISVYLNGGSNFPVGASPSYLYSVGAGITPYYTVNLSLGYSENIQQNGYSTKTDNVSIAYSPFSNLFVSSSVSQVIAPTATSTTTGYNIGWSPLQGGILQLSFGYNQTNGYGTNESKERSISTGMSLRITPTAFLDASYTLFRTEYPTSINYSDSLFVEFRKQL